MRPARVGAATEHLVVTRFVSSGVPPIDEWACEGGRAPYVMVGGGTACAKAGSELAVGATWDLLGNRPLVCDNRRGWVQVEFTGSPLQPGIGAGEQGCLHEGAPVPPGWQQLP